MRHRIFPLAKWQRREVERQWSHSWPVYALALTIIVILFVAVTLLS